jgi:prolyl oligopeptidase PreP (S9A serine peptidase family)
MPLLDNLNAMYVVANIRGGDEFGEKWHTQAVKDKR